MIPLLLLFQMFPPADLARFHEERIARLTAGTPEFRAAQKDLGLFWLKNGNPAGAEAHLRLALPDAGIAPFLAEALAAQGRPAEAEAQFKLCPESARCLSRLAELAESRRDVPASIRYLREALRVDPTPVRRNDLAQALEAGGERKEAEALFRQAIAGQPAASPEAAIAQNNLASLLHASERFAEAEPLQRAALATMRRTLGPRHVRTGLAAANLADTLTARGGRAAEAQALYRQALTVFEAALPPGHPWTVEAREALRAERR